MIPSLSGGLKEAMFYGDNTRMHSIMGCGLWASGCGLPLHVKGHRAAVAVSSFGNREYKRLKWSLIPPV